MNVAPDRSMHDRRGLFDRRVHLFAQRGRGEDVVLTVDADDHYAVAAFEDDRLNGHSGRSSRIGDRMRGRYTRVPAAQTTALRDGPRRGRLSTLTMGGMQLTSTATDRALLIRWRRDGDITARTALVERYLPFDAGARASVPPARRAARRPRADRRAGLVRAIDRYDLERDVALDDVRDADRDRRAAPALPRPRLGGARPALASTTWRPPRTVLDRADDPHSAGRRRWPSWLRRWVSGEEQVLEALGALASRHAVPLADGRRARRRAGQPLAGARPAASRTSPTRLALGPALATLDDRERRLIELRFARRPVAVRDRCPPRHVADARVAAAAPRADAPRGPAAPRRARLLKPGVERRADLRDADAALDALRDPALRGRR